MLVVFLLIILFYYCNVCTICVSTKMTPLCFFNQNFYNQWHFFSQILHAHVLNQDTYVDHFDV